MDTDSLCRATRRDGQPCTMKAGEDDYCFAHSPAVAERRRAGNAQGGRNKATPRRLERLIPSSLRPTLETLFTALDEVHDGTLDPRQASAMASLAGAIGRLYETASLEERLEAIEKAHEQNIG
jgi:hypothetical protein